MALATDEELQLHADMLSYVTNFIKFGDPMFDDRGQVRTFASYSKGVASL